MSQSSTSEKQKKLIAVLGPTASGKSELAIELAKRFGGQIVSADSRQIYKEMNIGTAKPARTKEDKQKINNYVAEKIPHYLIDITRPNQKFNVALYKKLAVETIKNIQNQGELPILVGGSGLYIAAVTENLSFPPVPAQEALREKLEAMPLQDLVSLYEKLDPQGAMLIDRTNRRRLIRAIEVCRTAGKPFWQQRKKEPALFQVLKIGIGLSKEKLRERIEKRVKKMFSQGLENEAKNLLKKYRGTVVSKTIGYQEWEEYFQGKISREQVKKLIIAHTIQLAKRQITWFRKDKEIKWIRNFSQAEKLIREFLGT